MGKATAGPAVYICDSCGRLATETATTERASKGHTAHMMSIPRASDEHSCSFCAKGRAQVDSHVSAQTGETICNECLELCGEIMTGSASASAGT